MEDSQLISQKSTILHDQFGRPLCAAQVDPINGWAHPPTGEVCADLQCASRAPPCPPRVTRADLNRPVDQRRKEGTSRELGRHSLPDGTEANWCLFLGGYTLLQLQATSSAPVAV